MGVLWAYSFRIFCVGCALQQYTISNNSWCFCLVWIRKKTHNAQLCDLMFVVLSRCLVVTCSVTRDLHGFNSISDKRILDTCLYKHIHVYMYITYMWSIYEAPIWKTQTAKHIQIMYSYASLSVRMYLMHPSRMRMHPCTSIYPHCTSVGQHLIFILEGEHMFRRNVKIAKLNRKKRELRAEDFDTSTELTKMRLESSIRTKVKSKGLFPAKNPPQKIKVTTKK